MLNSSKWQREFGFKSHWILSVRFSFLFTSQHAYFISSMEGRTDMHQAYIQEFYCIFFLLELCILYLFCGCLELLSAMLSTTQLSWSLSKEKNMTRLTKFKAYLFLIKPGKFRTAELSMSCTGERRTCACKRSALSFGKHHQVLQLCLFWNCP